MKISKKLKILSIFIFILSISSCSKDDSTQSDPNNDESIEEEQEEGNSELPIIISEVSQNFLLEDDVLTINGENFIKEGYTTQLLFNEVVFEVSPNSNSEIQIPISKEMTENQNKISLKINDQSSNLIDVYIVHKGWHKIENGLENDIVKSEVFDNSNIILSLIDIELADKSYNGRFYKYVGDAEGYILADFSNPINSNLSNFKMYNEKIGVATQVSGGIYSNDFFETYNFSTNNDFSTLSNIFISFIDETSFILSSSPGGHIYNNRGTIVFEDYPSYMAISSGNSTTFKGAISAVGKASDGSIYELGFFFDNSRNLIHKYNTEQNTFQVIDSITVDSEEHIRNARFYDSDLILSNSSDKLSLSNDLAKTWSIIKDDIDITSFFIRTRTEWYIVSSNKIYVTKDSGSNWELELEVEELDVISDISFSTKKIIVSGNKGLQYIKHE